MPLRTFEQVGRRTLGGLDEVGRASSLLGESLFWTVLGRRWRQPVRVRAVFAQMMQIGIAAVPITGLLATAIGVMLAVQSLYSLGLFGAESFAHVGIALSLTREFAPLIVGILIAGRSGSALAARISTMSINQEVDALRAIGLNPVRFLVAPALLAMIVMLPCLTMWANMVALTAAGLFVSASLDMTLAAYTANIMTVLGPGDVLHGLGKSVLFAVLIVIVAALNGSRVTGGAEGVGRVTTRSVVHSISAIVLADMVFGYLATQ
ncbi:MAG TPA: ABC transporter permease [Kiloniellales bacterium]|jgi:phospholipid/cholesterol/gamma-HCH transport system permease protein